MPTELSLTGPGCIAVIVTPLPARWSASSQTVSNCAVLAAP